MTTRKQTLETLIQDLELDLAALCASEQTAGMRAAIEACAADLGKARRMARAAGLRAYP